MELRTNRILLQGIKKENLLGSAADRKYDYEDYKFTVIDVGKLVEDKTVKGKTIIKQKNIGVEFEHNGESFIVIREDDIIAVL